MYVLEKAAMPLGKVVGMLGILVGLAIHGSLVKQSFADTTHKFRKTEDVGLLGILTPGIALECVIVDRACGSKQPAFAMGAGKVAQIVSGHSKNHDHM